MLGSDSHPTRNPSEVGDRRFWAILEPVDEPKPHRIDRFRTIRVVLAGEVKAYRSKPTLCTLGVSGPGRWRYNSAGDGPVEILAPALDQVLPRPDRPVQRPSSPPAVRASRPLAQLSVLDCP